MLTAEACNTGPEPFIRYDNPALRRDRLAWVKQNYVRDDTLTAAKRFVVPIRTVHAGSNPKYFSQLRPPLASILEDFFRRSGLPSHTKRVPEYLSHRLGEAYERFLKAAPCNSYAMVDKGWLAVVGRA